MNQQCILILIELEGKGNIKKKQKIDWPDWVLAGNNGKPLKTRTFKAIIPLTKPPVEKRKRGGIRVLKIYNRFSKVDSELKKWPHVEGYERFNVCKNNKYQDLSPMLLGPVYDENGEEYGKNIEDAWQCSKVFEHQLENGKESLKSDEWWAKWNEWSRRGRFSGEARRHRTIKSTPPDKTLFSYYMGDRLDYITSRKRMYAVWYAQTVKKTNAYKDLKARHLSGQNLLLLEYDGLDRDNPEENKDLDEKSLQQYIDDPSRPFGHALVLACVLLGFEVWKK